MDRGQTLVESINHPHSPRWIPQNVNFWQKNFFSKHNFESRDICSFINKIYSNKQIAPYNKWIFLILLKFFYTSSCLLARLRYRMVIAN